MKTLGQLSPKAAPLAVAVSLVFFAGNLRAFGPGGAGNGGGANGGGAAISGAAGGGSRGGFSTGGNAGAVSAAPAAAGARGGVSFSNSPARAGTGTFTQSAGFRGNAPSGLSLPYRNVQNGPSPVAGTRPAGAVTSSRPGNAWSGTAVGPSASASSRALYNSNGYTSNRFTGQVLDPAANGANLPTVTNGWTDRGAGRNGGSRNGTGFTYRLPGRYRYSPYVYGPAYAPYIGYLGGGIPYYEGAYPYSNDVASADVATGPGTTVSPQYTEQTPDANGNAQPNPASQPQATPAPQNPNASPAAKGTIPNNGPDSLVEAVQEELIRRGYFGGKVDAMFNPETKEALRKFQADHHLAETGLINEATLHALQLD